MQADAMRPFQSTLLSRRFFLSSSGALDAGLERSQRSSRHLQLLELAARLLLLLLCLYL